MKLTEARYGKTESVEYINIKRNYTRNLFWIKLFLKLPLGGSRGSGQLIVRS